MKRITSLAVVALSLLAATQARAGVDADRLDCSLKMYDEWFKPAMVTSLDLRQLWVFKRCGFWSDSPGNAAVTGTPYCQAPVAATGDQAKLTFARALSGSFEIVHLCRNTSNATVDMQPCKVEDMPDLLPGDLMITRFTDKTAGGVAVVKSFDRGTYSAQIQGLSEANEKRPLSEFHTNFQLWVESSVNGKILRPGISMVLRPSVGTSAPGICK